MKPDSIRRDELRLVSLLPSATEIVCALGLGDRLMGVTHCCDYPPEVRGKPLAVHGNIPVEEMDLDEIDRAVSESVGSGRSLYHVDDGLLREIAPTHILTQDLCQVCAPAGNEVTRALNTLRDKPEVLWMSPHSVSDIEDDFRAIGRATGREAEAGRLVADGRRRLDAVAARLAGAKRPRVFCAEWIDPIFCAGHWIPEMVEIAGGMEVLGRKWRDSVRVSWSAVREAAPGVIVLMFCGYDRDGAKSKSGWLIGQAGWNELPAVRDGRAYVVDAGYFSRPGPRVIDGVELLAYLFHPDLFDWNGPADAWTLLSSAQDEARRSG